MPEKYDPSFADIFWNNNINCVNLVNEWTNHFYQMD